MQINRIGVVGAGIMGNGIAQVAAQSGFDVVMLDEKNEALERGFEAISNSLSKFVEKNRLSVNDLRKVKARIMTTTDMNNLNAVDIVIEAVPEDLELKKYIFEKLDSICREKTILASNTSSLSITEIASFTKRPDKIVGMHFANPVPLMTGIEIVRGLETSQETMQFIYELAERLGKVCSTVKDGPGFAGNRLLMLLINESFLLIEQGISEAEDIDRMCKLSFRHPMGPLELADLIGLNTVLAILEYLHQELGERYRPSMLLKQMVKAGRLGRKSGRGTYDYRKENENVVSL